MVNVTKKISDSGNDKILVTERGASFGYNTLVSDMRSLPIMAKNGYPVIFDAMINAFRKVNDCLLYTSPSPRDKRQSRMPSSA